MTFLKRMMYLQLGAELEDDSAALRATAHMRVSSFSFYIVLQTSRASLQRLQTGCDRGSCVFVPLTRSERKLSLSAIDTTLRHRISYAFEPALVYFFLSHTRPHFTAHIFHDLLLRHTYFFTFSLRLYCY